MKKNSALKRRAKAKAITITDVNVDDLPKWDLASLSEDQGIHVRRPYGVLELRRIESVLNLQLRADLKFNQDDPEDLLTAIGVTALIQAGYMLSLEAGHQFNKVGEERPVVFAIVESIDTEPTEIIQIFDTEVLRLLSRAIDLLRSAAQFQFVPPRG